MSHQVPPLDLDQGKLNQSTTPRSYFLKSLSYGQLNESPLRNSQKINSSPIRALTTDDTLHSILEEEETETPKPNIESFDNINNSPQRTLSSPQERITPRRNRSRRRTYTSFSQSNKYPLNKDDSTSCSKGEILPPFNSDKISPRRRSSFTKKNSQLSPRLTSPQLSPRSQPKSPRTPRGSIDSSYRDFIQYVKQRAVGTNSPRPAEIVAFCKCEIPICLFYSVKTRRDIGRILQKHPKLWSHLLKTIKYPTYKSNSIEPEILHDILNGLKIQYQLPNQNKYTSIEYSFKKLALNKIKDSVEEKRYLVLIKDGQVQEVIDTNDPDLLVYNFKRNYHRYVPIFKWFQEHDYKDFKATTPRLKNLYQIVMNMGAHKLFGYIENTEYSSKEYVKLVECSVYS